MRRVFFVLLALVLVAVAPSQPRAQANKLQLHFMDVGQGDGAVLIAPNVGQDATPRLSQVTNTVTWGTFLGRDKPWTIGPCSSEQVLPKFANEVLRVELEQRHGLGR